MRFLESTAKIRTIRITLSLEYLEMRFMRLLESTAVGLMSATLASSAFSAGNTTNDDFREAKKMLEKKVYFDHRVTLYCGYSFDKKKNIDLPSTFFTEKHKARANRVEWEHVVPAENFGRSFEYWREGSGRCVDKKGHFFKGRRCAEELSEEYRLMQADMYNLYPAVGAVNAVRSNFTYEMLPGVENTFGSCEMKIKDRHAEPPERARGQIARSMLYMADTYGNRYRLGKKQRRLAEAWNNAYPVDEWECIRAARIAKLQGNVNEVVNEACRRAGLTTAR